MRLTRRGWALLGVVVLAVVLAAQAGQRSLNAVAAPALTALVLAALLVWWGETATLERSVVRPGYPGDERTVSVAVDGRGLATVTDTLPAAVEATAPARTLSLPARLDYDVTLPARGRYEFGPVTVAQRDPLGLVEQASTQDAPLELVVYPPVYDLWDTPVGRALADPMVSHRQEFDHLREYVHGDALRDIHWAKSAQHTEDFVVMEFEARQDTDAVRIVADATTGHADAMASAAASLALLTLDADRDVALTLADDAVDGGGGRDHRRQVLHSLAGAGPGLLATRLHEEADVAVRATGEGVRVRIGTRTYDLEGLLASERPGGARQAASDAGEPASAERAAGEAAHGDGAGAAAEQDGDQGADDEPGGAGEPDPSGEGLWRLVP
jgi:uncharacterized protein (DUF58 family)